MSYYYKIYYICKNPKRSKYDSNYPIESKLFKCQ